ncbi:MAG: DUF2892 domain-containing protein [Spirochaetia bacterium]|nr:DUF2892 domain-containing protein [Spirochaetia bacterium]
MKKNMGLLDKVIRIALSVAIMAMILNGQLRGTAAIVLGIVVLMLILTSVIGTCHVYIPFGIDTRSKKQKAEVTKEENEDKPT